MWLLILWSAVLAATLYLYLRQIYSHFDSRGLKTEGIIPLLGNMTRVLLKKEHFAENIARTYFSFPGERFVGRFDLTKPMVVVRDVELIKKITVKDCEHFLDHRVFIKNDSIFGRTLFALQGQEWKDMRSTLSPAFTSSKIRLMVPFMVEVGDQIIASLLQEIKDSEDGYLDVEVKDLTTRYANDVIASCAFGLKVDSYTERDNPFYTHCLEVTNFKLKHIMIFIFTSAFPWLMSKLKISVFAEKTRSFLRSLVLDTMKDRERRNLIRPDMIHLLMQAKKGQLKHEDKPNDTDAGFATVEESSFGRKTVNRVWPDDDLVAQAVIFLFAGFESISTTMAFLLYELAVNPDVQERLAQEIRDTDAKNGGKFDYTTIQEMTYMDMVVSETLRRWFPALNLDRQCIKDYNMGKPNDTAEEDFIIRKGDGVTIPAWAIHLDPQFFPNPEKFDPERFSEENKHKIVPFSFMPFGLGPRNCIGSRFALCEVKVLAYQLLLRVEVTPGPKTPIPAQLDVDSVNLKLKGGHWMRFRIRF